MVLKLVEPEPILTGFDWAGHSPTGRSCRYRFGPCRSRPNASYLGIDAFNVRYHLSMKRTAKNLETRTAEAAGGQ
jgi:hypothetical protein